MGHVFLKASGLTVANRVVDATFEIREGARLAIIGPSGAGKTSLLRLMAGFSAPDDGTLEINGEVVAVKGRTIVGPERRNLGYAFQEPALMPHLDVQANVCLGHKAAASERKQIAESALAMVGLPGYGTRRVYELSGGEAQRVQLARLCASQRAVILLDEPFASVDRMCRADLVARFRELFAGPTGRSLVAIVTHDPADAREFADTVMLMRNGKIVCMGSYSDLASGKHGEWPRQFIEQGLMGRAAV